MSPHVSPKQGGLQSEGMGGADDRRGDDNDDDAE